MALRCRRFYEDQGARTSILAGAVAPRPDTLTQTGRIVLHKPLADGAGHTFLGTIRKFSDRLRSPFPAVRNILWRTQSGQKPVRAVGLRPMALQDLAGCIAATLVFATFSAKGMVPLRVLGVASNIAFVGYASMAGLWPILILHSILLPMNTVRLREALICRRLLAQSRPGNDRATTIAVNDNEHGHRTEPPARIAMNAC